MTVHINTIYDKYNKELKPLISEIEGRLERFEEPLLINLMAQFDYVSLAILEDDSKQQNIYLQQALSHLDIAITNSYQYLIYALVHKNRLFKKRCGGKKGIAKLADGKYVGEFISLEKKGKNHVRRGMKLDDCNSYPYFKEAYDCYIKQEIILEKLAAVSITNQKLNKFWTVVGWIVSILISVIVGCCVNSCLI